jgi:RNA polymerase sigma factor (sigma-70 family)
MSSWLTPARPLSSGVSVGGSSDRNAEEGRTNASLRAKVDHFFRQHHTAMIKFFSARLHSVHEAKDVAQETYEWLLQHQEDPRVVRWIGPINPLVYRVAWHIAGNRMAKRQRHMRLGQQIFDASASVAVAPEQLCAAREDLAIIEECLKELPPRCRMVFILARLEGLSFEEIAGRMNISVRSVYRYVERALEHCLQRLDEDGEARGKRRAGKGKSLRQGK